MNHPTELPDDVLDVAVEYVLGTLPPDEAAAFERSLAGDAGLAAEVERLRRTVSLLPLATLTEPPPDLRGRVLEAGAAKLRAAKASGGGAAAPAAPAPSAAPVPAPATRTATVRPFPTSRAPRRVVWSRFVAAAAAAIAVALGMDAWRVRQELSLERELVATLQEPNVVKGFRLASTAGGGAYGTVALDMDAKRGAVVVRHLPALPEGKVYRLWAQVADKAVPCGDFNANAQGMVQAQFAVPVESYTAPLGKLFVTVEAKDAPMVPSGPRVMESV